MRKETRSWETEAQLPRLLCCEMEELWPQMPAELLSQLARQLQVRTGWSLEVGLEATVAPHLSISSPLQEPPVGSAHQALTDTCESLMLAAKPLTWIQEPWPAAALLPSLWHSLLYSQLLDTKGLRLLHFHLPHTSPAPHTQHTTDQHTCTHQHRGTSTRCAQAYTGARTRTPRDTQMQASTHSHPCTPS